ncbi:hypothetical protein E1189_01635 [Sansalvadorimonas verongulae]|nr:hypothetical protein [Sansalvadorimonas verongulae]
MRVKQAKRIEGGAAEAGSVPRPLALGIATAPTVRVKQVGRIEGSAAKAGSAPLPSTNYPLLILAYYFYFQCRTVVVKITWDC